MAEGMGVTLKHPVGPEQNLNKNSGDKALGNSWNLAMLGLNKVFKDGSTIFFPIIINSMNPFILRQFI